MKSQLSNAQAKIYLEYYARCVLADFFPDKYSHLELKDKPDLQDLEKSIGVEVTSVKNQSPFQIADAYDRFKSTTNERDKTHYKKKLEKLGAVLLYDDDKILGFSSPYAYMDMENFKKSFMEKLQKLNSSARDGNEPYAQLNHYHLYISSDPLGRNIPGRLKIITEWAMNAQQCMLRKFEDIYFFCLDELGVCHLTNGEYERYGIPYGRLGVYKRTALSYVRA